MSLMFICITAFQLNLAPFLQLRQKPKEGCAHQDAYIWDTFSTFSSCTDHSINSNSFVHSITLIGIHCSCTLPELLQNTPCAIHSNITVTTELVTQLATASGKSEFTWLSLQLCLLSLQADHWLTPSLPFCASSRRAESYTQQSFAMQLIYPTEFTLGSGWDRPSINIHVVCNQVIKDCITMHICLMSDLMPIRQQ